MPGVGDADGDREAAPAARPGEAARVTVWLRGRVQGVGLRWWIRCRALELGLSGSATNLDDGRVEVSAEGDRRSCESLLALLAPQAAPERPSDAPASWYPRPGRILGIAHRWSPPDGASVGFVER